MGAMIYANTGDNSNYAGAIGWMEFAVDGNPITLIPGGEPVTLSGTMRDGTEVSFTLTSIPHYINSTMVSKTYKSTTIPTYNEAPFGVRGYIFDGIPYVTMDEIKNSYANAVTEVKVSNISVKSAGTGLIEYAVVVADAESTNSGENLVWKTNGEQWVNIQKIPPVLRVAMESSNQIGRAHV